jgi:hypothetical protein
MTSLNEQENLLVSNLDCWTGMLVCKRDNNVIKVKVKQKKVLIPLPLLGKVLDLTINNSTLGPGV